MKLVRVFKIFNYYRFLPYKYCPLSINKDIINGYVVNISITDLKLSMTESGLPVKRIRIKNEPKFHKLNSVQQNQRS